MQFRKYEFSDSTEWDTLKGSVEPVTADIVELGHLITVPGTYDNDGREITPPTYSTKIAVDILWHEDTIPSAFTQYEVWPSLIGKHTFYGMEELYFEAYNNRQ